MSQGITVLEAVLRELGGALGPEFAVSIEETHHVHKKDAPSRPTLVAGVD
jgi:dihydrodipicolinate reductase